MSFGVYTPQVSAAVVRIISSNIRANLVDNYISKNSMYEVSDMSASQIKQSHDVRSEKYPRYFAECAIRLCKGVELLPVS